MTEFLLWQFELCLLFVFWRSPENFVSSPGCPCHAGRLFALVRVSFIVSSLGF